MNASRVFSIGLVAAASLFVSATVSAQPVVGSIRPHARVVDADGRALELPWLDGKPSLIVYEDKASATLNAHLKSELSRVARGDRYRHAVALVPIANVSGYDFWPVRGFVKDAIRDESKKLGATIYCDWDGSAAKSMGIAGNTSSVILVGRKGRVLFAHSGRVSVEDTSKLLELLRGEVERQDNPAR